VTARVRGQILEPCHASGIEIDVTLNLFAPHL